MVFSYFFSSKKQVPEEPKKEPKIKKVYLVINKNSQTAVGIFTTLEKAISEGNKATYYTCSITEFVLDDKCKYLVNPVYESK